MNAIILLDTQQTGTPAGYVIGALIALLILGYLLYALIKPEKF
jgi:K+-transporting ATPase KdpF subunit